MIVESLEPAAAAQVYILPTIRINNGQYRGKLSVTEVMRALCAAFVKGKEPPACLKVKDDECRPGSVGESVCAAKKCVPRAAACWRRPGADGGGQPWGCHGVVLFSHNSVISCVNGQALTGAVCRGGKEAVEGAARFEAERHLRAKSVATPHLVA